MGRGERGFEYYKKQDYFLRAGREFELDLLGGVDTGDETYKNALEKIAHDTDARGHVRFSSAVELAKRFQPGDPTNPNTGFLRDLRVAIIDKLGLGPHTKKDEGKKGQRRMDSVRAYTAVDTPLDRQHGVDGFITIHTKEGREIIVTMDVTKNTDKADTGYSADVIVTEIPDPDEGREVETHYLDRVEQVADRIVAKYGQKLESLPARRFLGSKDPEAALRRAMGGGKEYVPEGVHKVSRRPPPKIRDHGRPERGVHQ